jgi:subtilase family serine protease
MKSQSLLPKAFFAIFTSIAIFSSMSARAGEMRALPGHVPPPPALLQPLGRLPGTRSLRLAISLPLHNRDALTNLLQRLYDPASPDYHRYLTSAQFSEKFGPTAPDYQAVIHFARTNGLEVVATRDSRMLLDIQGKASDVEKAFHVTLWSYQHPAEARQFYAPDVEPSVEADLPILDIVGLGDYAVPRPMLHLKPMQANPVPALTGSGPGNYFLGSDFRNAYAPGVTLTGAGQSVGLLELDGYTNTDIKAYENLAGLPNVPLINIDVTNYTGSIGSGQTEVTLDIDMAIAMAPGLSAVYVFQAGSSTGVTGFDDILDSMASSNQIKQFSSSWGYSGFPDPNTTMDTQLQKMATQGQSFYQASGDGDAWYNTIWVPAASSYLTSVGGTLLTMNGSGASYSSETVWNEGNQGSSNAWAPNGNGYIGSGGGVSSKYSIPSWQQSAINSSNQGSTTRRNIPDVALTADDIFLIINGDDYAVGGTSCAAPLWAGFTALVNQQAAAGGSPTVGFINPAIYTIGQESSYTSIFHDITTGNNTNAQSDNLYFAVPGYDLCTGWGTPTGAALINALSPEPLRITPSAGFVSSGPFGGPFSVTNQVFTLTNIAPAALNWSLINTSLWLTASSSNGTLTSGGAAASVSIGLNSAAASLTAGSYAGAVLFSNLNDTVAQSRQFILTVSKIAPALAWAGPAAITYGAALTSNQLNATANTPGSFAYAPPAGTVLNAGTNILSVIFTPANTTDYSSATDSVSLVASPAPLSVTANNANRPYEAANPAFTGTIIGVTNGDNITAAYSCSATNNSPAGMYLIVPSLVDPGNRRTNYTVSLNDGTLTITMIAPVLTWPAPAAITYGTALSSNQLDATANVPGGFAYNPSAGTVPGPGTNMLGVLFTPADMVDYSNATGSVSLVVTLVPIALNVQLMGNEVVLSWIDPASVFALQTAPAVTCVFTNVPGAASPYTNAITNAQQFFQLAAPAN